MPKFKVGDRVKVTNPDRTNEPWQDATGVVTSTKFWICIDCDVAPNAGMRRLPIQLCFEERELELLPPLAATAAYNFKVTKPEEIDVQRICDEAPEDCNLLVVTRSDLVGVGCLVRLPPFGFTIDNLSYTGRQKNIPGRCTGWTFNISDWCWFSNRRSFPPHTKPLILVEDDKFIDRLKQEIAARLPKPKKVKKINVKVTYGS